MIIYQFVEKLSNIDHVSPPFMLRFGPVRFGEGRDHARRHLMFSYLSPGSSDAKRSSAESAAANDEPRPVGSFRPCTPLHPAGEAAAGFQAQIAGQPYFGRHHPDDGDNDTQAGPK
jgi:hypothetical protein